MIGTLLGRKKGNKIFITNCFPVPHNENEETVVVDMDYHANMLELHQRVSSNEVVVGWYSTGDKINYISSLMNDVYKEHLHESINEPVHVTVDASLSKNRMSVKAYTGKTFSVGESGVVARFESAELEFNAYESEKIGVDALINSNPDGEQLDAPATILSDFENLEISMGKLLDLLESCLNYVQKVQSGDIKGDLEIGAAISQAIASIPPLDPDNFNTSIQDILMVVYLTNLTRTQIALADKINVLGN